MNSTLLSRVPLALLAGAWWSPSAAADDSLFGAYDGGNLDIYACYDDGPIEFDLPVDRVISRDKTGWAELFLSTPVLRMRVYDVDDDDDSCPEQDHVYINDLYVGTLSGANDTWSEFNIEIPPELWDPLTGVVRDATFNGPGIAPTPGQNHVRVEIDTGGCRTWCVEVDYAEIQVEAVRPVTFIHGILSRSGTWSSMLPLVPGQNGLAYDVGPRSATYQNAPLVVNAIDQTLTAFGTDKTNMVCHSKGGLDTEWASFTAGDRIEHLVTLGSPLQGTELADHFLSDHGFLMPITAYWGSYRVAVSLSTQIRGQFYDTFVTTELPGISYHHLAGTPHAGDAVGCPLNPFLHVFGVYPFDIAHDAYVPCDRAQPSWGTLDATAGIDHVSMTSSPQMWDWAWDQITGGPTGTSACELPPAVRSLSAEPAQLASFSGAVAPGGSRSGALTIDSSVQEMSVNVFTSNDHAEVVLVDPSGDRLDATATGAGITYAATEIIPGALYIRSFRVEQPEAGAWSAEISSTSGGDFELAAEVLTTLSLNLQTGAQTWLDGESVAFEAHLDDAGSGVAGATVRVALTDTDTGGTAAVTLADQGSGTYRGSWTALPGVWRAEGIAIGTDGQGYSYERARTVVLLVAQATAALNGVTGEETHDDDGDGLQDRLSLTVDVTVDEEGEFQLVGTLGDDAGSALVSAAGSLSTLTVGPHSLTLDFPAWQVHGARVDGPYTVQKLTIIDTDLGLEVDELSGSYHTAAYHWYDFDGPPLVWRSGRDVMEDADLDGDLDTLTIFVEVEVTPEQSGYYDYNAMLEDRDGRVVAWYTESSMYLDEGLNELPFTFDATMLFDGQHQAPYALKSFYVHSDTNPEIRLSVPVAHVTGLYCLCTFDGAPPGCVEPDIDVDGFAECEGDCDDAVAAVNPTATEVCDAVDNNCVDGIDEGFNEDHDAFTTCGGDCDDADYFVHPEATERCNLVDDNCDQATDEGFDLDGDGNVSCDGDCDDDDEQRSSLLSETCDDGIDNDCDEQIDEDCAPIEPPTPDTPSDEDDKGGCGCTSFAGAPGGLLLLAFVPLLRRRRAGDPESKSR